MPLLKSSSKKAFKTNIEEMVAAGHPVKQAVAAAYSVKRKAEHKGSKDMKKSAGKAKKENKSSCEKSMKYKKHESREKKLIGKLSKMHPGKKK